jgi:hypothetical protein
VGPRPELKSVAWTSLHFPMICPKMVLRGLLDICSETLLFERGYLMIESGEIVWTPILPGKNGDWKQHLLIRSIVAACEGCDGVTSRFEGWVGKSSDTINRGGHPRAQALVSRSRAGWVRWDRRQRSRLGRRLNHHVAGCRA